MDRVEKVLKSYPDYSKSPPEYLARIAEAFASYPEWVQEKMAHTTGGLTGRSAFLPTVADVVKMGDELVEREAERAEREKLYRGLHRTPVAPSSIGFNPFPTLARAFADEPELLRVSFDALFDANRALHFNSKEAARSILLNGTLQKGRLA